MNYCWLVSATTMKVLQNTQKKDFREMEEHLFDNLEDLDMEVSYTDDVRLELPDDFVLDVEMEIADIDLEAKDISYNDNVGLEFPDGMVLDVEMEIADKDVSDLEREILKGFDLDEMVGLKKDILLELELLESEHDKVVFNK